MHYDLLTLLACPDCGGELSLEAGRDEAGEIVEGRLRCASCRHDYPIVDAVPRFVPARNYSSSFGFQWNRFRRTQLDSTTGQPISRNRFFAQAGWEASAMAGSWTLDVGCGAGRFAEVALATGTRLVAVDYSSAVDACRANLGPHPSLDVVQADVYRLPFKRGAFDFVYCFGVLQHTPDVEATFHALTDQLAPGGRLAVDVYPRIPLNLLWPKYWLRPLTRRMPAERLLPLVVRMVQVLWPLSLALGRTPVVGRRLRHALPIANYEGVLPLSAAQLKEWAVLDTFDMLAPAHDRPQDVETLERWFHAAALGEVEVFRRGLVVGRARREAEPARSA
jgi:SAM-dependent methyltransferase